MPKWSPNATRFAVSVTPNVGRGSHQLNLPKPIYVKLGNPKKLAFVIKDDGSIYVTREK